MLNQIAHTLPMKKYIFLYTRKKITPKLQQTKTSTHNDHKSGNVIFFPAVCLLLLLPDKLFYGYPCRRLFFFGSIVTLWRRLAMVKQIINLKIHTQTTI